MPKERPSRKRWRVALILALGLAVLLALLATGSRPWVEETRDATAQQVAAAHRVFVEAAKSRETGEPVALQLDRADLEALAAMVSQGFAPNRLSAEMDHGVLTLTASRPLPFRWLNIRAQASGTSEGVPDFRVRLGAIPLPGALSRAGLSLMRKGLALEGVSIPPFSEVIRSTDIGEGDVGVRVVLPRKRLVNRTEAEGALAIDERVVASIYCTLAKQQRADPDPLFAHQLRRALAAAKPTAGQHGAAIVALAMLSVSPKVGELTGDAEDAIQECTIPPPRLTLQGRPDSPKHWALSAALEVTTGNRFTAAMGEWKELSDSLSRSPFLARNDTSGFSFVDLATDRAGILTARRLIDPGALAAARAKLLEADDDALLPEAALALGDGMPHAKFLARYGATDDPRFEAKVKSIDGMLRKGGID